MKHILQILLGWISRLILWRHRPIVVVITGSVGKSSAKEAIFSVLSKNFATRKSEGNYNNEIGVPLTIIGSGSGKKNVLVWFFVFLKGFLIAVLPFRYPKVLVLEVAADRPGDLRYLMSFLSPRVSVVTTVGPSHLENFGKLEAIAKEKSEVVKALPQSGTAVLNFDDESVRQMASACKGKTLFYGHSNQADLFPVDVKYRDGDLIFKVSYKGKSVPMRLPSAIGKPNIYTALAGAGVGLSFGMNLVDIAEGLLSYKSPPGRLKVMGGVKSTTIIDDTYNSAPASALAALQALSQIGGKRKIAVLGNMEELGQFTEDAHRQVGAAVVDQGVTHLVTVGAKAKFISDQARRMGFPDERILEFETSDDAKKPVENLLEPGDAVLVKGSRSIQMEKVVKEIMAEPWKADELLVH